MSEFTDQLRQPSGYASLDAERSRAAEEIEALEAELDERTVDSARQLALLIRERQETTRLRAIVAGAKEAGRGQGAVVWGWSIKDKQMGYYVGDEFTGTNIEDAWLKLGEKGGGG